MNQNSHFQECFHVQTEGRKYPNFSLSPTSHLLPVSPICRTQLEVSCPQSQGNQEDRLSLFRPQQSKDKGRI
jgi:hypothetical protein